MARCMNTARLEPRKYSFKRFVDAWWELERDSQKKTAPAVVGVDNIERGCKRRRVYRCSICNETGHNKRSCKKVQQK